MGCGASKDVLDVKKQSADSKPIKEAGASEDVGRISNQEEMPVPSANIACETTSSVQVLSWRRVEDRLTTASEDRPAGTRRSSRAALRPLPPPSTATTFAEPHDPQENAGGNAGGDNSCAEEDGMSSSCKQLGQNVSDYTCERAVRAMSRRESRESHEATLEDKFPKLEQHASERESALNIEHSKVADLTKSKEQLETAQNKTQQICEERQKEVIALKTELRGW